MAAAIILQFSQGGYRGCGIIWFSDAGGSCLVFCWIVLFVSLICFPKLDQKL